MTTLIAVIAAASSLLLAAGETQRPDIAELGGTIVEQPSNRPFPAPVLVDVRLYDERACVATGAAGVDGRYQLEAAPGDYWLQVIVGGEEALTVPVKLAPGSWTVDLEVPPTAAAAQPPSVAWNAAATPSSAESEPGTALAKLSHRLSRLLRDFAHSMPPVPPLRI